MTTKSLRQSINAATTRTEINELLEKGKEGMRFASRKTRNRWNRAARKRWAELK